MKKIVVILLALTVLGCTKKEETSPLKGIACSIGQSIGAVVALEIQKDLACKNLTAIQDSVYDALVIARVCEERPKAAMGIAAANPICTGIGNAMLNVVLAKGVPAEWQCSGGLVKEKLQEQIQKVCEKVK